MTLRSEPITWDSQLAGFAGGLIDHPTRLMARHAACSTYSPTLAPRS
jgi:hypothetical protein